MSSRKALSILNRSAQTPFPAANPPTRRSRCSAPRVGRLRFDCLWVSGLTDEAWPLAARPNPFIRSRCRRRPAIPQRAPRARSRSAAHHATVAGSAEEVVFSWPGKEEDRDLAPSPLILSIESFLPWFQTSRATVMCFSHRKSSNPSRLESTPRPGQAGARRHARALRPGRCPFRAFRALAPCREELEDRAGLDARKRGSLLHHLMNICGVLSKIRNRCRKTSTRHRRSRGGGSEGAGPRGRFAELERERS